MDVVFKPLMFYLLDPALQMGVAGSLEMGTNFF
jgi:hypothetical protein